MHVRTTDPIKAGKNPTILKPGVSAAAIFKEIALTTNRKKPNVRSVSGRVNKTRIGQINVFTKPTTTDATKAAPNPSIRNPGTKWAVKTNATLARSQCTRNGVMEFPSLISSQCPRRRCGDPVNNTLEYNKLTELFAKRTNGRVSAY